MLSAGQRRRVALAGVLLTQAACCGCWMSRPPISMRMGNNWWRELIDEQLGRGGIVVAAVHHELRLRERERWCDLELEAA